MDIFNKPKSLIFVWIGLFVVCLVGTVQFVGQTISAKEPPAEPRYVYAVLPDQMMLSVVVKGDTATGETWYAITDTTYEMVAKLKPDQSHILQPLKGKRWLTPDEYIHFGKVGFPYDQVADFKDLLKDIERNTRPQQR